MLIVVLALKSSFMDIKGAYTKVFAYKLRKNKKHKILGKYFGTYSIIFYLHSFRLKRFLAFL